MSHSVGQGLDDSAPGLPAPVGQSPYPITQNELQALYEKILEMLRGGAPPQIDWKLPFALAKETLEIKVVVPPPVKPRDEEGVPPEIPGEFVPENTLTVSSTVGQRKLTYTAHQWYKVSFRDIITGEPVKLIKPTLVCFGEYREGWITPPTITLKEVKITIPEVPDLDWMPKIPKIPAVAALPTIPEIAKFDLPAAAEVTLKLPDMPDKPKIPELPAAPILRLNAIAPLGDIGKVIIPKPAPVSEWYCKAKDKNYKDWGMEDSVNHLYDCNKFGVGEPTAGFIKAGLLAYAKANDLFQGQWVTKSLANTANELEKHINNVRGALIAQLNVAIGMTNNMIALLLDGQQGPPRVLGINEILMFFRDGANNAISFTVDNVWGAAGVLHENIQGGLDQLTGRINTGLSETTALLNTLINGGSYRGVDMGFGIRPSFNAAINAANQVSKQLVDLIGDPDDPPEGSINWQIEQSNLNLEEFITSVQTTLNAVRQTTEDSVNLALLEVKNGSEWAINEAIKGIWALLGLARKTVWTPIPVRNVDEAGFEIQALGQDFKFHYLAAGLTI